MSFSRIIINFKKYLGWKFETFAILSFFFVSCLLRNPRKIFQIWGNPKVRNNLSQNHKKFARTTPSIKKVMMISIFHEKTVFLSLKKTVRCWTQIGPLKPEVAYPRICVELVIDGSQPQITIFRQIQKFLGAPVMYFWCHKKFCSPEDSGVTNKHDLSQLIRRKWFFGLLPKTALLMATLWSE